MLSQIKLNDWCCNLTLFSGFYDTRPALKIEQASWPMIIANIAPVDTPALVEKKEQAVYFIPCALKDAPLIGGTLEIAKVRGVPTLGKQRSAAHVTTACTIVADLDSIAEAQLSVIEKHLIDAGITFLLYSTHSHGRPDKPGVRCRLVVPVDMPLDGAAYKQAAIGLNKRVLDGLADPAGFALHQQQGIWATAPERRHLAFRHMHKAGVCSADTLLAAAPKVEAPKLIPGIAPSVAANLNAARVTEALRQFDANDYATWVNALAWLKAAYGGAAYAVWLQWSQTADEAHRATEDDCAVTWAELTPRIPASAGEGKLFAAARDAALAAVRQGAKVGNWYAKTQAGAVYLKRFHARVYDQAFITAAST